MYICSLQSLVSIDDPLTGINNRRQLFTYLSYKIKYLDKNERLYFILLDIDMFKRINNTYVHNEGDKAIVIVENALREMCRKTNGFCARYGGDEFAFVQTLNSGARINAFVKKITSDIQHAAKAPGILHPIDISVLCAGYKNVTFDIQ
ncbi:MAG: GGDEF domain-containing protein [Firmicutes bacterium]|nr:GGDEF domain-containing protein [Bacillota bacterium]